MAAQSEGQASLPLVGGITETVVDESAQGSILVARNVRLSTDKGTLAPRPVAESIGAATAGVHCYGVIPGCSESTLGMFLPSYGNRRLVPSVRDERLLTPPNANYQCPNYIAAHITDAGGPSTARSGGPPSVAIDDDGNLWVVWRTEGEYGEVRVCAEVRSASGDLLVPRTVVASYEISAEIYEELVGWTAVVRTNFGVAVLYATYDNEMYQVGLEVTGGQIQTAYAPVDLSSLITGTAVSRWRQDVCSDGENGAFFVLRDAGATAAALFHVNLVSPNTQTGIALSSPWDLTTATACATAVSSFLVGSTRYVAAMTASNAAQTCRVYLHTWNGTAFTLVSATTVFGYATEVYAVAVQPHHGAQGNGVMCAISGGNISAGYDTFITNAVWLDLTGVPGAVDTNFHAGASLVGRGCAWEAATGETYALFQLAAQQGDETLAAFYPQYTIPDPSVHLMIGSTFTVSDGPVQSLLTPIARYGIDGGFTAPHLASTWSVCSGDTVVTGFALVDYQGSQFAAVPRWCKLDMRRREQPSYAMDTGGVSTVAAAHPIAWDGSELCDVSSPHSPVLLVEEEQATGWGGAELPNGTYSYRAIFRYRDGSGQLRRSAPTLARTFTTDGAATVNVRVAWGEPIAVRTAPHSVPAELVVYITQLDGGGNPGTIFYYSTTIARDSTGFYETPNGLIAAADGADRLYSTGADNEPLLPVAPPALWDVETVGPRQFGIAAEYRNRVWATKLKERGVALEWAAELTQDFGEQAGKLMKVVSVNGQPRVLAERGVWAIVGNGPDNTGLLGSFGDPQLISTRGCRSRESVAVVPGVGVLFEGDDGVMTLLGDGVRRFETIAVRSLGAPSVYLAQHEVVWPVKGEEESFIAYNYVSDAWTTWTDFGATALAKADVGGLTVMWDDAGRFATVDPAESDGAARLYVERAWVAPNQPDGDIVARELRVRLIAPTEDDYAGIRVRVEFDYGQGQAAVERTWSGTELADLERGGRVTIAANLHGVSCRAVKVIVADDGSTGHSMRPLACELSFGATSGNLRRALRDGPAGSKALK